MSAEPLHDQQPGASGFQDSPDTVALLPFLERHPEIAPNDQRGNLARFTADSTQGLDMPGVVADGITGPARSFDGTQGLRAEDPPAATYLPQSVTVHALVRWDRPGQEATGQPGTLVSRGLGDSAAQRRCWHLELAVGPSDTSILRWAWEPPGGGLATFAGGSFEYRPGWYLFTATREYVRRDRVIVRYWQNQHLLAEHELTVGNPGHVGGGAPAGPVVLIGAAAHGQSYERFLVGDIDAIQVLSQAVTQGRVEALHRRLSYWQPKLYRAARSLSPTSWPPDPASNAQRLLKVAVQPIAAVESAADNLARNGLPPRCEGHRLEQWERCLALPRSPLVSPSGRQKRAQQALRRELGFTATGIKKGLAPLLGTAEAQVELITTGNDLRDQFASADLDRLRWHVQGHGSVALQTGQLRLNGTAGDDLRWDRAYRHATRARLAVAHPGDAIWRVQIASLALPGASEAGLFVSDGVETLLFMARRNSGGNGFAIGWRVFSELRFGDFTVIHLTTVFPVWLRIRIPADGSAIRVSSSVTKPAGPVRERVATTLPRPVRWAGIMLRSDDAALPEPASLVCDDALLWTPHVDRPFHLWVYRDRALGDNYDLIGARISHHRTPGPL
ncbi:MAG: hypothetical protein MJE77_11035 [Proteobacteria bacterium]|nr:hypothetical protein [Pseudomonadota bacterium]